MDINNFEMTPLAHDYSMLPLVALEDVFDIYCTTMVVRKIFYCPL